MKLNIKDGDIVLLIIVLILIVSYIFIKIFSYRSEPILMDYAKRKTNNIVSSIVNKSINDIIYKNSYDNIINIDDFEKEIEVKFFSKESVKYILKDLFVELKQFNFKEGTSETDWDESVKTLKKVTASQQAAILEKRKEDMQKRKDESEVLINQLTNVKGGKAPAKPKDTKKDAKGKPGDKAVVQEE